MNDLIKTENLIQHFKLILKESKKHLAFNEVMYHAKCGHESQCSILIDLFEKSANEMRRDDVVNWMNDLLKESRSKEVTDYNGSVSKQNSEYLIEKFIDYLKSGKEFLKEFHPVQVEEHSVNTKQFHDTINAMNSETDKEIFKSADELFDKLIGE